MLIAATSEPTRLPWLGVEQRELVEQVVAVVERQTITLIDVKRATAIEIAKEAGPAVYMRPWPAGLLRRMRIQLINRTLLLEEWRRYSQPDATEAEIDAALSAFRSKFPSEQAFARFLDRTTLTLEALKTDLRAGLRVDRILDFRIRSRIEATEQDVVNFRKKNAAELHDAADDVVIPLLMQSIFNERTTAYLKERLERSEVRLIGKLDDVGFTGSLDP
jgi:hypothetical protein